MYSCFLVLDLVFMHANVVTTCFHDVSMKYIHARVDGLLARILEALLHAYTLSLVIQMYRFFSSILGP